MKLQTPIRIKKRKIRPFFRSDGGASGYVLIKLLLEVGTHSFRVRTVCDICIASVDESSQRISWKRKSAQPPYVNDIEPTGVSTACDEHAYPDPYLFEDATGDLFFGEDAEGHRGVEPQMIPEWDLVVRELHRLDHEIIRSILLSKADTDYVILRGQRQEVYERCKAIRELVAKRVNQVIDRAVHKWDVQTRDMTWHTPL
jgi:hypothetical protein